jgi:hypothetical protein
VQGAAGIYSQEEKVKIATQFFQELNAALFAPPNLQSHFSHLSGFLAGQGVLILTHPIYSFYIPGYSGAKTPAPRPKPRIPLPSPATKAPWEHRNLQVMRKKAAPRRIFEIFVSKAINRSTQRHTTGGIRFGLTPFGVQAANSLRYASFIRRLHTHCQPTQPYRS